MQEDTITEVGIDGEGRLYVRPSKEKFDFIYRAAMEVNWDRSNGRLFGPKPREWTYAMWFKQILAAATDEYGIQLRLTTDTIWENIPEHLKIEIKGT